MAGFGSYMPFMCDIDDKLCSQISVSPPRGIHHCQHPTRSRDATYSRTPLSGWWISYQPGSGYPMVELSRSRPYLYPVADFVRSRQTPSPPLTGAPSTLTDASPWLVQLGI